MNKIINFLKTNWILILVIIYVVSPIDFMPLFFGDDLAVVVAELGRRFLVDMYNKRKNKNENAEETNEKIHKY